MSLRVGEIMGINRYKEPLYTTVKFEGVCENLARRRKPIDAKFFLNHIEYCAHCGQIFSNLEDD